MKYKIAGLVILQFLFLFFFIFLTNKTQDATSKNDLRNLDIQGDWQYVTDPFCNEPGIKVLYPDCDTSYRLIEIEYAESYIQALLLFETTDALLKIINENQILMTEKTIIKITTPLACAPIYVDPHSFDKENSLLMRVSDNVCDRAKLENEQNILFVHNFYTPKNLPLSEILKDLPILKEKNLTIKEETESFYRIYNPEPQKNLIFKKDDRSYWEYIYFFVKHNKKNQTITIKVDSFLGAGLNPPNISDLVSGANQYEDEINDFMRLVKQQILQQYNGG